MIPHSKPTIGLQEQKVVNELLESCQLAAGNMGGLFTASLKEFLGVDFVFLTATGTTAEIILLRALGIREGQEVIIPSYVCKSVYEAILAVGATPVFCDIGDDWVMKYETICAKVTQQTAAIVLVHIFGIDAWDQRFADFQVPVIEDFCQAFGLGNTSNKTLRGKGGFYSFHATKCITTGEGGAITVNDAVLAAEISRLQTYEYRSRFSDYQSVLGLAQLKQYKDFLIRRREIASHYLSELPNEIVATVNSTVNRSVNFRFPLRLTKNKSEDLQHFLSLKNIAARKGVDTLLHELYQPDLSLEITEKVFEETLCLPIYPSLTNNEMKHISASVNEFFNT
jgi:UDP-4-amino-4-deoxy-L-arabinose-oxoglutarate aminotransferase